MKAVNYLVIPPRVRDRGPKGVRSRPKIIRRHYAVGPHAAAPFSARIVEGGPPRATPRAMVAKNIAPPARMNLSVSYASRSSRPTSVMVTTRARARCTTTPVVAWSAAILCGARHNRDA